MWKKKVNKLIQSFLFIFIIGFFLSLTVLNSNYFEITKNLDIFFTLFKQLNASYVDEIDPKKTIETGINSMLSSLDPYTQYILEEDVDDYKVFITGEYVGLGVLITSIDGKIIITKTNEGFSAEKEGLKIGDEILKVGIVKTKEKSVSSISKLLKGQAGTSVDLEILRNGIVKKFTIIRSNIVLENVSYHSMVTPTIGYIKLTDFMTNASKEVKKSLKLLKSQGAESIILDVRENPGGLLTEAVSISNIFISKGKLVVETRGREEKSIQEYRTLDQPTDIKIPLVILTSNETVSASEIVAGTLQDYDRAVLIGKKTFGKGLVQTIRNLPYNAQIKITTAKYYIPSGRSIQAINYFNRNKEGSVGRVPDSLMVAFKTEKGRIVYDGGGVTPDIILDSQNLAPITVNLLQKAFIFHYANHYFYTHPSIPLIQDFCLTEDEYGEFTSWLANNKKYTYTSKLESAINKLEKDKHSELFINTIKAKFELLKKEVNHNKEKDLSIHKVEIKKLLEAAIINHYYLNRGKIEYTIQHDSDINYAIALLNDLPRYKAILNAN